MGRPIVRSDREAAMLQFKVRHDQKIIRGPAEEAITQLPYSYRILTRAGNGDRVRDLRLTELPMPDLDQIKQGEQGAWTGPGRFAKLGRAPPPQRDCREHVGGARLMLGGHARRVP